MKVNLIVKYHSSSKSCGYLMSEILRILKELAVKHVLGLGARNVTLYLTLTSVGYETVGIDVGDTTQLVTTADKQ